MSVISYPPILEGVLPAFYGNFIKVPFTMNRAVDIGKIQGFKIKIKTIQSNSLVLEQETNSWDKNNLIIIFKNLSSNKLQAPNHYKVQIAYIGTDNKASPYSTVGIIKYTTKPKVTASASSGESNIYNPHAILGTYQTDDASEKLYSSYFTITDTKNNLFFQSEEKIHNSFDDVEENKSEEKLNLIKTLELGKNYYVQFHIKTINEIEMSSSPQIIRAQEELPLETNFELKANLNYENGYVDLYLTSGTRNLSKKYKLARADSKDNFETWNEILDFEFSNTPFPISLWQDFTVEQGVSYQYALYQYNNYGFYSTKRLSQIVYVDFEDMFLYDGERQLKIRFNPKVSSFKTNILEMKQDTMGGKYPFIFRNGYVNYKEFPISGLISYLEDDADLFFNKEKFLKDREIMALIESGVSISNLNDFYTTVNLTGENIHNERQFKMAVLDWLTNGKPKIFRSPAEGNYLVRLMNTTLSPLSDGINRMLHTFSSTAYEIDDYNLDKLIEYNFINTNFKLAQQNLSYRTFKLTSLPLGSNLINSIDGIVTELSFYLQTDSSQLSEIRSIEINSKEIQIYNGYTLTATEINSLEKVDKEKYTIYDSVTIGYYPNLNPTQPEDVNTISTIDVPCYQAFGKGINGDNNLLSIFADVNKYISHVYEFKISACPINTIYQESGSSGDIYYTNELLETRIQPLPYLIYKIISVTKINNGNQTALKGYYYKPYKNASFQFISASFPKLQCQYFDKNNPTIPHTINITSTSFFAIIEATPIAIFATPGVVIEIGGRTGEYNFAIADFNLEVQQAIEDVKKAEENLKNHNPVPEEIEEDNLIEDVLIDPSTGLEVMENIINDAGEVIGQTVVKVVKTITEFLSDIVTVKKRFLSNILKQWGLK